MPLYRAVAPHEDVDRDHDDLADDDDDLEDEDEEHAPLLPIFSAAHLDSLPVFDLTHAIRLLISQRCETTLSWEQLRSPQVSQFLVKPIQVQIKSSHFNRATLYSLIANALQFNKEGSAQPGNVGVLRTRALLAELLAVRLLKEYSTRELIDVLSYDFDPLAGSLSPAVARSRKHSDGSVLGPASARTSTLEVAIKAHAKRFLAHPLVVQHLEAIWAGSIVFHSAADSLHRHPVKPAVNRTRHYGATHTAIAFETPDTSPHGRLAGEPVRRSATLYDPANASLFKLSRLRVPKYRQIFSTISYAIMLALFLAVLIERSLEISALEVIFWFWSAGYVLDELIAYSDQGFGLYIQSVWNALDIGILLFFLSYYLMRLYGVIIYNDEKFEVAHRAYDVLASTAILLFPRLFSSLDHYRYFSQLLIAFRLMAQDLIAVLLLVAISCSGFFVAFTLAFGGDLGGQGVAYALFQIVMGFTPAAWNVWSKQNILGQALLTVFLIICHFLVVTILITVLTNSFMAIVKNANEEHQFLFAVNTISMVKSDALFSYIAPSNLLGWLISPLRYIIPLRHFVRVNRTLIKVTHFPILFLIYGYEKLRLSRYAYEPAKLVETRGRPEARVPTFIGGEHNFSPGFRVREPSVTTFRKDRALDEVFRQPFGRGSTVRRPREGRRSAAVSEWMSVVGKEGGASPPPEQPSSILERLEGPARRPRLQRSKTSYTAAHQRRGISVGAMSTLSDPEERHGLVTMPFSSTQTSHATNSLNMSTDELAQPTDADGDDELVEGDENEDNEERDHFTSRPESSDKENEDDHLASAQQTPNSSRVRRSSNLYGSVRSSGHGSSRVLESSPGNVSTNYRQSNSWKRGHNRHTSTNTILFNPLPEQAASSLSGSPAPTKVSRSTARAAESAQLGRTSPERRSQARPILANRNHRLSTPNLAMLTNQAPKQKIRQSSFDAIALDLASDIGDNRHNEPDLTGFTVGSFQTQMADALKQHRSAEESSRMSRMVLARMNTLEEGFKDILKEVKEWRNSNVGSGRTSAAEDSGPGARLARRLDRKQKGLAEDKRGSEPPTPVDVRQEPT